MKNSKRKTPKPSQESERNEVIQRRLQECADYFKDTLTEVDIEVVQRGLRDRSVGCINAAFNEAIKSSEFMPRLAQIYKYLPEEPNTSKYDFLGLRVKVESAGRTYEHWTEQCGKMTVYFQGDPKGLKVVERIES